MIETDETLIYPSTLAVPTPAHVHAHTLHNAILDGLDKIAALVDRDAQAIHRVAKEVATALDLHSKADPAQQPKLVVAIHNVLLTLAAFLPPVAEKAVIVEAAAEIVADAAQVLDDAIETTDPTIAKKPAKPAKAKKPRASKKQPSKT